MNVSVHQRIRVLLEETNDAFSSYDTGNADFAAFATLALSEFRNVLDDPDLTKDQLTQILRKGMSKHRDKDSSSWAAFMAHHIANTANNDSRLPKTGYTAWKAPGKGEMESTETA